MDKGLISRVESLLRQIALLLPETDQSSHSPQLDEAYETICGLVLDEQVTNTLWHEPILSQLNRLFTVKPPSEELFGHLVDRLHRREQEVRHVNNLFFRVLNKTVSVEEVYQALSLVSQPDPTLHSRLILSGLPDKVRLSAETPSAKVVSFLEALKDDLGVDLIENELVTGCLQSLQQREAIGRVNALLVRSGHESSLLVPLDLALQPGNGQVRCTVPTNKEFDGALNRAQSALYQGGYLPKSVDVICCLVETEPEYVGSSMALAAAAGMYGAGSQFVIDPYTAFTGDVVLEQGEWRVKSIHGLAQKLSAARLNGCRRVFIPKENLRDLPSSEQHGLTIVGVDNVLEVLLELQSSPQASRDDSTQTMKINVLMAYCQASGWPLSQARLIQNGVQFRVAPLNIPELTVTIYETGTHVPKQHPHPDYRPLLNDFSALDQSAIPIRGVNRTYKIQDQALRGKIMRRLEELQPQERRDEQYCEYSFKFEREQERLVIKQYSNGKLLIQGSAGDFLKTVLENVLPLYKLHYPNATLTLDDEIGVIEKTSPTGTKVTDTPRDIPTVPLPHIGTDESGKGDYFGPMVIAGILIDAPTQAKLEALGVKDSKLLSDKRCRELASQIRSICGARCEEVEIPPDRYNELYEEFRKESQNLNHLLAWGHARAIESLLGRFQCSHAVADQFGDEKYILSRLMQKGRRVNLRQLTKGERFVAVAAASILARDRFLMRMDKLSLDYGVELPKGASSTVITAARRIVALKGPEELKKIAKVHHKTTAKILDQTEGG